MHVFATLNVVHVAAPKLVVEALDELVVHRFGDVLHDPLLYTTQVLVRSSTGRTTAGCRGVPGQCGTAG